MLAAQRQREILSLLEKDGSVRVTDLGRRFQVTEETIRRDLSRLERGGRLVRSHGGAVSLAGQGRELPYWEREAINLEEKIAMARLAVTRIEPGDTVMLDGSTTAWQIARHLEDRPLTVLTNAIKVALELATRPQIRVLSVGGTLSAASLSFVGPLAEQNIEQYHAARLFLSCKGVDLQRGLMDANEDQGRLRRKMIERSDYICLLADFSKFGVRALTAFAPLSAVHEVITDERTPPDVMGALRRMGLNVLVAGKDRA